MTLTELIQRLEASHASAETICNVRHVWRDEHVVPPPTLESIFKDCCKAVGVNYDNARSKSQSRKFIRARFLFFYYCHIKYETYYTLAEQGRFLNDRHHTTVMHGRDTFIGLLESNDIIAVNDLENLYIVIAGGEPKYFAKPDNTKPKANKYVRLFYERRVDRYYRSIKSIRSFYGFGKHVYINKARFAPRVVSVEKLPDIDLIEY